MVTSLTNNTLTLNSLNLTANTGGVIWSPSHVSQFTNNTSYTITGSEPIGTIVAVARSSTGTFRLGLISGVWKFVSIRGVGEVQGYISNSFTGTVSDSSKGMVLAIRVS